MSWTNEHSTRCPVTRDRRNLLAKLAEAREAGDTPLVAALEGAGIEYDNGGDQETENCTCGMFECVRNDDTEEVA